MRQHWRALEFASAHLKRNREVVLVAVETSAFALDHVGKELLGDPAVRKAAVQHREVEFKRRPLCRNGLACPWHALPFGP